MSLTWRFLLLTALAGIPVALRPQASTFVVMAGLLVIVGLLDWLAAPGIARLGFQRTPGPRIRLTEETHAVLTITNPGRRTRRLHVRDAWAPTAGGQVLSQGAASTAVRWSRNPNRVRAPPR